MRRPWDSNPQMLQNVTIIPKILKFFQKNTDIHEEIIYERNVMNISEFLKNLKAGIEVPQNLLFLKVYDKNNDSVFDEKEIKKLKKDISVFAAKDGNKADLSDDEALAFFNKKMIEYNPEFKEIKGSTDIWEGGSHIASQAVGLVKGWFNQFKDKHINAYDRLENNTRYQNLSESKKNIAKSMLEISIRYMLDVEEDADIDDFAGKFEGGGLAATIHKEIEVILAACEDKNLSEEDAKTISENLPKLLQLPNFQILPNIYQLKRYGTLPTDNIEFIVNNNMYFKEDWNSEIKDELEILLKADKQSLERYVELKKINEKNLPTESRKLVQLDDESFQKAKSIKANPALNKFFNQEDDIINLVQLGDNAIQTVIEILSAQDLKDIKFETHELISFANEPEKIESLHSLKNTRLALFVESKEHAEKIKYVNDMINQSLQKVNFDKEQELERQRLADYDISNEDIKDKKFFDEEYILELANCSTEQLNMLYKLLNTEFKSKDGKFVPIQVNYNFTDSAKNYSDENLKNFSQILGALDFDTIKHIDNEPGACLYNIAMYPESDVYKFMIEHPKFKFEYQGSVARAEQIIKTPDNPNMKYIFDFSWKKDDNHYNLIETQEKIPDSNDKNKYTVKTINKKNNIEQLTEFTNTPQGELVTKDVVKYYNKDGTLNRTVTSAPSSIEGIMNQSVTYPDGSVKPLQFVSQQDGNMIIEKHFTSPLGTTTDYHNEETADGIRIIDYTIKKDDEVLLDKHYTFQQIDENHILSSVNGVPYDVIFEEEKITITNKNDNTKNVIDLTGKIGENNRDLIFAILKKIPPDRLLIISKRELNKIQYDEKLKYNANWHVDKHTINIGNFKEADDSEVNLNKIFAVFMHEFGHFADLPQKYVTAISKGKGMGETFDKELAAYKDNSTQIQQDYVDYLIHYNYGLDGESEPLKESLGDAEMGVFATDLPLQLRMRLLEFQANFPELIAKFINAYDKQAK